MTTNYTAPFGRIRWHEDIIPMSQVREMALEYYSGTFRIKFFYVNTNDYTSLHFESETQRDEFLEKLNIHLNQLSHFLRNSSYIPDLGWIDFTPEPQPKLDLTDVNEIIDEIVDVLQEQKEEQVEEIKLQEPDTRPAWKKLLNPK